MTNKLILAATLLVACDGGKDSGDDSTTGAFTPSEGEWITGEQSVISDTCGLFDDDDKGGDTGEGEDEDEPATLTMTGEDTFSLEGTDGDFSTSCTLSGYAFTCEATTEVIDYASKGIEAALTLTSSYSGSFDSETSGLLNIDAGVACEGKECDFIEKALETTLPCSASLEAAISFSG